MTRSVRAIALSVVTVVSVTGCGAAHAVLGIHEPPKANAASVPLTLDQAQSILTRDFTAAHPGETSAGPPARAAPAPAYRRHGLRAANAAPHLTTVQPTAPRPPKVTLATTNAWLPGATRKSADWLRGTPATFNTSIALSGASPKSVLRIS